MVKQKIGKPKIYVVDGEEYEPGKIYEISGSNGEICLCQVNPETGKLEEVKGLGEVRKNQEPQKAIQESENSGGDNKRYVDIDKLVIYTGFKKSAIRYWIGLKKIPFIKQGKLIRFDLQKIDQWMKEKEVDK